MHHADLWVAGTPDSPGWAERLAAALGGRHCGPDEGLRLRLVMATLPRGEDFDLLALAGPTVEALGPERCRFVHLELMQGPEAGVHLAFDNRLPALLTGYGADAPGDSLAGASEGLPEDVPVHANLELPALEPGWFGPEGPVRKVLRSLAPLALHRIHQVTVAPHGEGGTGVAVGLEAIHDEQGATGGLPAGQSRAPHGVA